MDFGDPRERARLAGGLVEAFVERTGVDAGDPQGRRYLWTDAHAVCALVELHRLGDPRALDRARRLVDLVHRTLGRHRPDDRRSGPLGGADEATAREHPTAAGLRIGKPRPERGIGEAIDPRAEWDRDGQYFHYLTRWTHALAVLGGEDRDPRLLDWAAELARVAVRRFAHVGGDGRRALHWKLSIDLTRPLVAGTSAHDPLDGWVTVLELGAARAGPTPRSPKDDLRGECALLRSMLGGALVTADPLGLGGLLEDATRLAALASGSEPDTADRLLEILDAAELGLAALAHAGGLDGPAESRLAFRELGLAIGLQGAPRIAELAARRPGGTGPGGALGPWPAIGAAATRLAGFLPLADRLLRFWLDPGRRSTPTHAEHRDIDDLMLAVALVPGAQLSVPRPPTSREAAR